MSPVKKAYKEAYEVHEAYNLVKNNPNKINIKKYQAIVYKDSRYAYFFARDIPGADIKKCQEKACLNSYFVYQFAWNVPKADIDYCLNTCKDLGSEWYYRLLVDLPLIMINQLAQINK